MSFLIPLAVLAGIGVYLMTPEDRLRLAQLLKDRAVELVRALLHETPEAEPFRAALRARTRWPVVTIGLAVVQVMVFIRMVLGPGALGDPDTLRAWGASFGPITTNGEWWRLVTSSFVHSGLLHVLVSLIGLVPIGMILERLVGHATFGATYIAAAALASVVALTLSPVSVGAGASGAIFGIYGLLAATALWALIVRHPVTVPVKTVKVLGACAALFTLHSTMNGAWPIQAELAGFATGLVAGVVLTRGVIVSKPPVRRVAFTTAATLALVVVVAIPLKGLADVRPELARIAEIEQQTASAYDEAVGRFRKGWETSEALASLVEDTILPRLEAARASLRAVGKVPPEHRALVEAGEQYLALRCESWRTRVSALRTSSLRMLQEAEATERAALHAFDRMRPGEPDLTPPAQ